MICMAKILYTIVFVLTQVSLTYPQDSNNKKLDWILGDWIRTNNDKDQITFEYWEKESDSCFRGIGVTLELEDTVFKEQLQIIWMNNNWHYVVFGVNPEPTFFNFIAQTDSSFYCENQENDFPKKIAYYFENEMLIAKISDDSREVSFYFEKYKEVEFKKHMKNSGRYSVYALIALLAFIVIRIINRNVK